VADTNGTVPGYMGDLNWVEIVPAGAAAPASPSPSPAATPSPSPSPSPSATPPPAATCVSSLQSLINAAPAGSTVVAGQCVYREAITISKRLTLVGGVIDGGGSRPIGVKITASDVTLDGTEVRNHTTPNQQGAVDADGVDRVRLLNVNSHHNQGSCMSISGGTGHLVKGGELAYCRQQGYHLGGISNTVIDGVAIHDNNLTSVWPSGAYNSRWAVDPFWEAGGGKIVRSSFVTFQNSRVYRNGGPGIWFDIDGNDTTIRNNRVYDNDLSGIFFEISRRADITGNVTWGNGRRDPRGWAWPADVLISSSRDVKLHDNVVGHNSITSISVLSQDRCNSASWVSGGAGYCEMSGIQVYDNDVLGTGKLVGWYDPDGGSSLSDPSNRGWSNRYESPDGARFEWAGMKNLAQFNATAGEEGGSLLSSSERSATMSGASIP
jgi:parallel beta-helix repeat protein